MWAKIIAIGMLPFILVACHSAKTPESQENTASICAMLKPKVESENYQTVDQSTMKRKNAGDQAKLVKEYESYGCPEILDAAPPP